MFQTPGPTARMSQAVNTVNSLSLVLLSTKIAKSRTVLGSLKSLFCATSDIKRWFLTNHSIVSESDLLNPSLEQTFDAILLPNVE